MSLVSSAHRNDLDIFDYVKDVLHRLLAGETNYDPLRPDVWKQSHLEAIRMYRVEERQAEPTPRPSSGRGGRSPRGAEPAPAAFIRSADPMAVVGAHDG